MKILEGKELEYSNWYEKTVIHMEEHALHMPKDGRTYWKRKLKNPMIRKRLLWIMQKN